ncbi:DNA protecting protein DprA [Candidatus Saccharibacteria bacterium RIFCSPHIGHO2_12_FULL_42_8]|nr:MAG: DNA protecting protein DprA [Candidatus Saccharibacteria bacterium RIFCSPHIGHO2_12_FULL_42_8]
MKINRILTEKEQYLQRSIYLDDFPKKLYILGNLPEKNIPTIAIVGSRKTTQYGREVTERLASDLARAGVVIISGLALGIDSIAHRAALEAKGVTIAVLANGLDTIYPRNHQALARQIVENDGAILSEYKPGTPPLPFRFLERNRIVSGIADGIVVVEAATRSGTLSTAAHALNQNKEVFAVPGNITSPLSSGCNALIKQGATPVTKVEDILEIIAPNSKAEQTQFILGDTPEEVSVLQLLQKGLRDGDELLQQTKLEPVVFNQTLTMLEIKGQIKPLGGNQWTLK